MNDPELTLPLIVTRHPDGTRIRLQQVRKGAGHIGYNLTVRNESADQLIEWHCETETMAISILRAIGYPGNEAEWRIRRALRTAD